MLNHKMFLLGARFAAIVGAIYLVFQTVVFLFVNNIANLKFGDILSGENALKGSKVVLDWPFLDHNWNVTTICHGTKSVPSRNVLINCQRRDALSGNMEGLIIGQLDDLDNFSKKTFSINQLNFKPVRPCLTKSVNPSGYSVTLQFPKSVFNVFRKPVGDSLELIINHSVARIDTSFGMTEIDGEMGALDTFTLLVKSNSRFIRNIPVTFALWGVNYGSILVLKTADGTNLLLIHYLIGECDKQTYLPYFFGMLSNLASLKVKQPNMH